MPDEDEDASATAAETRSAPGELALDAASSSTLATETAAQRLEDNTNRTGGKFKTGHHRGAAGFTSGPPWPTPKKDKPWQSVKEMQRQQQAIEFIEQELTVMAQETQLGIGKYRPRWLQRFANRRWMLFWMCWFCMVQGLLINGLVPSSLATIERRFSLSTSTIGRIVQVQDLRPMPFYSFYSSRLQFYDFGYVLFCIPVSYFGGRHSKPLVLGLGLVLMALGSAIFTTPHSLSEAYTSTYNADDNGFSKCERNAPGQWQFPERGAIRDSGGESSLGFVNASPSVLSGASFEALKSCPSPENQVHRPAPGSSTDSVLFQAGTFRYVFLFCLAHFLHGIGATPLFTIGVSYIDENVGPALSSLYLGRQIVSFTRAQIFAGIFYAFAIFGPAIGFLASSTFLRYHTDFLQSEHHGT
jgi:organic anion transporter 4A